MAKLYFVADVEDFNELDSEQRRAIDFYEHHVNFTGLSPVQAIHELQKFEVDGWFEEVRPDRPHVWKIDHHFLVHHGWAAGIN